MSNGRQREVREAGTTERGVEICILINSKLANYIAGYDCLPKCECVLSDILFMDEMCLNAFKKPIGSES